MSDPITDQRKIIEELYQIMTASSPEGATSSMCRYHYRHGFDDGSYSVGHAFKYVVNGQEIPSVLDRDLRSPITGLVTDLHAKMKAHTGGDWDAFTLFINEDGSVTTKFEYPDESVK